MAGGTRRGNVHVDGDGVRTQQLSAVRSGTWLVLVVLAALFVVLIAALRRSAGPPSDSEASAWDARRSAVPAPDRGRAPAPPAGPGMESRRVPAGAPPTHRVIAPPRVPAAADRPEPDAGGETAFGDSDSDEPTGLALFPPMGTDPIKRGVIVPDDFELPPGYVRHHQVTDDGEDVPPILMFHPDYHPVGADGQPIALPADRVVPPEMVPPGMPVQMLELPEDQGAPDAAP